MFLESKFKFMKSIYKITAFALFTLFSMTLGAQNDTLFFMDFQIDPSAAMAIYPEPGVTDTMWVNFDEDAKPAQASFPSNFFLDLDWNSPDTIAATDSSFVFVSRSWLADGDTISSNWLISPAMQIVDDKATLHWKSAPFQGPRYVDGYAVKILVGSQDFYSATTMVETVFRAAEMTGILGESSSLDVDSFTFSPGYIHANGYTLTDYFVPADTSAGDDYHLGILEPHSLSLADYAGKTIYVAWHHDSADDNLLMIDDLLLLGTTPLSGTADISGQDLRFVTYPNPVVNFVNVMFRLPEPADVQLEIYAKDGKRMAAKAPFKSVSGEMNEQFDLRSFPSGAYTLVLTIGNQRFTKNLVKD
jgi:hypothetical protein